MDCPVCKISSMRRVVSGTEEVDCCTACGALWFDYGEIKELSEGRLPAGEGVSPEAREIVPAGAPTPPATGEKPGALLSRLRREAEALRCPKCAGTLGAMNFQMTGIPVFHCPACNGILAPRASAGGIAARFRFLREHGEKFAALGETLAGMERRRIEDAYGPGPAASGGAIPLPLVVPLADDGPAPGAYPFATWCLIAVALAAYLFAQVRGAAVSLPGGLPGLPSGTGFAGVPKLPLLVSPFLHGGLVPLVTGSLFLFVLGDNVEDRMGRTPYLVLYVLCGLVAGAAHVLWGRAGGPPAMGSAGAVAGILGAYLVFFPNVAVRMYGMGRVATLPAYLFACAWVVTAFFVMAPGPLSSLLNPAPLSLQGNLAGFGAGVCGAILWRFHEQTPGQALP